MRSPQQVKHPWVSSRHAPLYELTFPGWATDDEIGALCGALEAWHAVSDHDYVWVFNLSRIREATPVQRQMFREHMLLVREHDASFHRGVGLVVPSGFLRGIVTATFWFAPPVYDYQMFSARDDAFAWAQGRLGAASG
jgi:hypothetical protein